MGPMFPPSTTTTPPPLAALPLLRVRLAPVNPNELLLILLLFIALLRRLGLLPPPGDDDEFASLEGVTLEDIRAAAHAYVVGAFEPAFHEVFHDRIDAWYVRATTGEIEIGPA